MPYQPPQIPSLFISDFEVDESAPFRRYLNRLEVEIGKEDYQHLKQVDLLDEPLSESACARMIEMTDRLLRTSQNNYNCNLIRQLGVRIYLDPEHYVVYYLLKERTIRFTARWRQIVLKRFFRELPVVDTGWQGCHGALPGFVVRFLPDDAGGVLLLKRFPEGEDDLPLLTAPHGPYDPLTLEVTLYFLRTGKGGAAMINLGFAGREPLADENTRRLNEWGVPLNPSNIDVIYPYVDDAGHPYSYKLERGLRRYLDLLEIRTPNLILDLHACVGTSAEDQQLAIGLGGLPPFRTLDNVGAGESYGRIVHLQPNPVLRQGLALIRDLSRELFVQFCAGPHQCYNFAVLGGLQLIGSEFDPLQVVRSLVEDEERYYLPREQLRWLPGAGANALQRIEAAKLGAGTVCMHVEMPVAVRKRIALRLKEMEIGESLTSSGL